MRRVLCVYSIFLLFLGGLTLASSDPLMGQVGPAGLHGDGFSLEQNYPNPFNPETRIPFVLGEEVFESGQRAVVSLRIYNVLQQFVAAPTALNHVRGEGVPLLELEYSEPGRYEAYWDGRDRTGEEVASGVYFLQLTVNGESQLRRMFVTK